MSTPGPIRLSPRRRNPLIATLAILVGLTVIAGIGSRIFTDKLWFDSVGFVEVFSTQLLGELALFGIGFALIGGLLAANMYIAYRLRPQARRRGASAILDRYRDLLEHNLLLVIAVPSVLIGGLAGLSASSQVLPVLAWLHRVPSGIKDSKFGLDTTFFMLEYPVWRLTASMVLSALVLALIAAVAVHFAVGNLASGRPRVRGAAPGPVARHLSVLAALVVAVYGIENLLDRYGLMVTPGVLFDGLKYTDDHARMTAKLVVAVIAFIVAALFLVNAFVNRVMVPIVGVVLMVASGLILSLIYPAIVQAFTVKPNEPDKEHDYIGKHVQATRQAFGIDNVSIEDYPAVVNVTPGQLKEDAATLPSIRLMDPGLVSATFEQLQQVRGYYSFPNTLAVDRYTIDGKPTDAVVAARELLQSGIPDKNWNNIHTVYTHGYGFVSAYGNRRQSNGEPVWITRDIPPVGDIKQTQSRIYFGEETTQFAIVGRLEGQAPLELDTPGGGTTGGESYNTYDGSGGVGIGTLPLRAMYALRFSDVNLLLSDRINAASKILYDRTPQQRVQLVAPWLTPDKTTYPAIVDGRLVWIVDCYTTSSSYPNAQSVSLAEATSDSQTRGSTTLDERVNYMRNAVKAVVDAYDGTVNMYAWDDTDPILKAYSGAFPDVVKPKSAVSPDLLAHLRYPSDLFKVQRQLLARYHMTDPGSWYQQSDLWEVPSDPTPGNSNAKEPAYYLTIRWPKESQAAFSLTGVFVPKGRQNLAAYLAVNADAASPDYGKLRVLRMSGSYQIDGPGQTFNQITTDPRVAQIMRNYTQGSSEGKYGNLLTLPVGGGLLYVQPIFAVRSGTTSSYPVLTYIAARFGQHVGIGTTLQEALDQVFAGDAGASTGELPAGTPTTPTGPTAPTTPTTPTTPTGQVDQAAANAALDAASEAMTAADAALKNGDLATYQAKVNEAKAQIAKALQAMGR